MGLLLGTTDLGGRLRIADKPVERAYLGALLVYSAAPANGLALGGRSVLLLGQPITLTKAA